MFTPVENKKIYMQITNQIRNSIEIGELKPGDPLPTETELAQAFGASRSSIREALSALEILGLIESKGKKKKIIKTDDPGQINYSGLFKKLFKEDSPFELFESRLELEPSIASLAAERANQEELSKLIKQFKKLEAIQDRVETDKEHISNFIDEYMEEDRNFHLLIGESAHNHVLFKVFTGVHMTMKKYHWKLLKRKVAIDQETLKKLNFEHGEILEAIKAKDPEKARRAMKSHVENLREALF